jgi:Second Messenger Oligonucleotide or Dinucleotide Synthetase domain
MMGGLFSKYGQFPLDPQSGELGGLLGRPPALGTGAGALGISAPARGLGMIAPSDILARYDRPLEAQPSGLGALLHSSPASDLAGNLLGVPPPWPSLSSIPQTNPFSRYGVSPWIAVRERFAQFHGNLALTAQQQRDGRIKCASVVNCLNRAYHSINSDVDNSFWVDSWSKDTAIRPPRDVDVYFILPFAVYARFQNYFSKRQSALLQEVKEYLKSSFPNTDMSGDGQVVIVDFGSYCVEVVPAFALTTAGRYWICNTGDGGSYKETAPWDEVIRLESADVANARNVRPLIRMMKAWQASCSVPIKSFHLELLATQFIVQSPWRLRGWFYFDWIARDFFAFLFYRANETILVPGTSEVIFLGNAWQSYAASAYRRASKACDYEYENRISEAGEEWQKIFGAQIPRTV